MKKTLIKLIMLFTLTSSITSCYLKDLIQSDTTSNSSDSDSSSSDSSDSSSTTDTTTEETTTKEEEKEEEEKEKEDTSEDDKSEESDDTTDEEEKEVAVTSISLSQTSLSLVLGTTSKLSYEVLPTNATNKNVTFYSSDKSVATIDSDGNISALKVGTTTITITAESDLGISVDCLISVIKPAISSFVLTLSDKTFEVDDTKTATMTYLPTTADTTYVKWLSSNIDVASVTSDGLIEAVSKGSCEISVYDDLNNNNLLDDGEVSSSITITVNQSNVITFTSKSVKLYKNISGATYSTLSNYLFTTTTIYKTDLYGDIPYIEGSNISDLFFSYYPGYKTFSQIGVFEAEGNSLYRFIPYNSGSNKNNYIEFDASENVIRAYKWADYIFSLYSTNNGYPGEVASPTGMVKDSEKTNLLQEADEVVTFDLNNYDIHLIEYDDKLYVPLYLLQKLIFLDTSIPYFYNGNDEIFQCGSSTPYSLYPYFYSSQNGFYLNLYNLYSYVNSPNILNISQTALKEVTPTIDNALYQFEGVRYLSDIGRSDKSAAILVLFEDGSAKYCGGIVSKNTNPSTSTFANWVNGTDTSNMVALSFKYTKEDDIITLTHSSDNEYTIRINYESDYAENSFGENMQEFNYNLLCFNLDYFYGLKNDREISSFDTYFKNTTASIILGSNNRLFNDKADTIYNHYFSCTTLDEYSLVLNYTLNYALGDGHTGYTHMPIVSNINTYVRSYCSSYNTSERVSNLSSTSSQLTTLRKSNLGSNNMIQFYDNNSAAVLRFDSFRGNTIGKNISYSSFYDSSSDISSQYNSTVGSDCVKAIYKAMAYIKDNETSCENIVFDVSINGGGRVFQIPLLLALMSDDPYIIVKNGVDNRITEYHYKVDLNGDGTYGGEGDTLKDDFNFYVLISDYSFSCGTAFPTACKNINCATIIGDEHSGGGACPVGYGGDCFGSYYQISASYFFVLDEDGYPSNDSGVYSSKIIDSSNWYTSSLVDYL